MEHVAHERIALIYFYYPMNLTITPGQLIELETKRYLVLYADTDRDIQIQYLGLLGSDGETREFRHHAFTEKPILIIRQTTLEYAYYGWDKVKVDYAAGDFTEHFEA
ncbi:hypothetical protein [Fibrella forsythiae]|uniref:WYL domain-containing protein n=1 Tax=Fibrella forsythiae TaxID=2817061 RepID=A0ABS3JM42_9BACT|nr:hypothetical protein [Fibrella forsythiae]MBO0951064.1 hypothetical protein [Fibrella forsythiae]